MSKIDVYIWYAKIFSIIISIIALSLALVSYSEHDYSIMYDISDHITTHNYLGLWGAQCAGLLLYLFGGAVWVVVFLGAYISYIYIFYDCTKVYCTNISTIFLVFIISMLVSAYIQVYPGACGIVLLEFLRVFLEPWQVVLFLFCLLWAFAVAYALEPLYRLYIFLKLLVRAGSKKIAKLYMSSISRERRQT